MLLYLKFTNFDFLFSLEKSNFTSENKHIDGRLHYNKLVTTQHNIIIENSNVLGGHRGPIRARFCESASVVRSSDRVSAKSGLF